MKKVQNTLLLLTIILSSILFFQHCKDKEPKPDDSNNKAVEEYFEIEGVKYTNDQIISKTIVETNTKSQLRVYTTSGNYPWFIIEHQREPNGDTLVPRSYDLNSASLYSDGSGLYFVKLHYAEGSAPLNCQFNSTSGSNGSYKLENDNGKLVSNFENVSLECTTGGSGNGTQSVSGNIVWENK